MTKEGESMDINDFYLRMRQEVSGYSIVGRQDTAAFLIWFLINYFRIEHQGAIDCVCDQTNDKGIDGIYADEEEEVLYLFQSKFSPRDTQRQGDNDIKNFIGARHWFENEDTVRELLNSTASHELKSMVQRFRIIDRTHFKLISVFVTNKHFNRHAKEYISVTPDLETYDSKKLFQEYTYFADEEISTPKIDLQLSNPSKIIYELPDGTAARVYAIRAKELIKLEGIQDRTLFYQDVRYGIGKTRVNKSIKATILNDEEHSNFFLYHNGITIVCGTLEEPDNNRIRISNYAVINGCQSMLSLYENRDNLSNSLYVLTKIINLNVTSPLVRDITYYANNQNSISLADLHSNDSVQKSLQRQFEELFGNDVLYKRKSGENEEGYDLVIEKDFAAQLIEAVYNAKPHNTHLKQKLFGEEYINIFSRKTNAEKIYLANMLYKIVEQRSNLLDNEQIRTYGLSIFFFAYALSDILRKDTLGEQILDNPRDYVTTHRSILLNTMTRLWELITPDINVDIEDYTTEHDGFFDYKNVFKNSVFIDHMNRRIKADYDRLIRRNASDSFTSIYSSFASQGTR